MQLTMPVSPAEGPSKIVAINAHAQVHDEGEVRALVVGGCVVLSWASEDSVSESLARVMLVRGGIAKASHVASAFGCARATVYRELGRYDDKGPVGLVAGKPGPKGARIFGEAVLRRAVALKRLGLGPSAIASKLGLTTSGLRSALKRAGHVAPRAVQLGLTEEVRGEESAASPPVAEQASVEEPTAEPTAEPRESWAEAPPIVSETSKSPQPVELTPEAAAGAEHPVVAPWSAVPTEAHEEKQVAAEAEGKSVDFAHGQVDCIDSPWDRTADRALAQMGLLQGAPPQFGDCQSVSGLGALLALPALMATGLFDVADKVYSGFGAAFYGVRSVFVCLSLMALLRMRRAEQLRHHSPPALGRLLGLDRAPEVKTLRQKVKALVKQARSAKLQEELAVLRAASHHELMGFLYVDGHVRAYNGKVELPKAHVTRMRLSMPATVDHWVNDRDGEPLLVLTATPTTSLAKEMLDIVGKVRGLLGSRRATIVFDRGGWSPKLFAELITMGFDILTYRKGKTPEVEKKCFREHSGAFDGREVSYALAERRLPLSFKGGTLNLREVVRLSEDEKHQTSIVTNREDLPAVEVAYRMFARWRQENFFKYMADEFALDALVSYATEPGDAARDVPNPLRRRKERQLAEVRTEVARLERQLGAAAAANNEAQRPTMRGFKIANASLGKKLREARARAEALRSECRGMPKRVTATVAAGGKAVERLDTETKRLTDVVKMAAYQAETALFRLLRPHYSRHEDEGRKLIASAMRLTGDIEVSRGELRIILQPAASPNRTRAIAKLCKELNATNTAYPGTQLVLRYSIRDA